MLAAKPNRRRFQYSLRTLLLFVLLANVGMAWFGARWRAAGQQREAVAAIRTLRGAVTYDYEADYEARLLAYRAGKGPPVPPGPPAPPGPAWARRLLGEDFFADVVEARYLGGPIAPGSVPYAWLEQVGKLPHLVALDLGGNHVPDAGLGELAGITRLRKLDLGLTWITDAGLAPIRNLSRLEVLNFWVTGVSDAGLETLSGLTRLRDLTLAATAITDLGL